MQCSAVEGDVGATRLVSRDWWVQKQVTGQGDENEWTERT